AGRGVATVVPVPAPAAKPGGRRGCKTSGTGCDGSGGSGLHSPGADSPKIRIPRLGADPRGPAPPRCRKNPLLRRALPGSGHPGDVRRIDSDIAGIEPAVFAAHWGSVDSAGWRIVAASDAR